MKKLLLSLLFTNFTYPVGYVFPVLETLEGYEANRDKRIERLVEAGIPRKDAEIFANYSIESMRNINSLLALGFPMEIAVKVVEQVPEAVPYILRKKNSGEWLLE